jgi:hypothetical protein
LQGRDDPIGALVGAEARQDLIQDDVVGDLDAVDGGQSLPEAPRQGAAAVHQLDQASPAQFPQRSPRGEAASPA